MAGILTGKIAVVTGGSAGIGYAVAKRLATAEAKVILASRNPQSKNSPKARRST
ncbi:SDR family NAD(P)-dependent oxidoreductase [Aliterella atlantica]|uniref:SDR family NAD(P)-dependent oxidoreductase n=1 Tax=Aliterella atlantica TaxID=1827278 RepID=UPI0009E44981